MFVPPPLKLTNKCERCGLLYPKKEAKCSHCSDLSDQEVIYLKHKFAKEQQGNANLGKLLLFIASIIALVMMTLIY
ncbi:MAG: hypothetical protein OQL19_21825 [Gammaproteobacteria bacterium]|nr:hypothetical protein [Gammaproteobacteria bacterium]